MSIIRKFNQLYPDIEVAVKTGERIDDMEKDKRIDLAIRYGTYDDSLKSSVLLTSEEIGMYATPSYIANIDAIEGVNLLETKWQNTNLAEISWHTLFKSIDSHPLVYKIRQFDQEHHIIQAALAGQGIALVSTLLVQNAIEQGWLINYNLIEESKKINGLSYYLVIPEHNLRSKSIMAFKSWITNSLKSGGTGL
jgi:LysR family glycine cleavage system transcriptional activator